MAKRAYIAAIRKIAVMKSSVVRKTRWRLDIEVDVNEDDQTQLLCHHYIILVHYLESEKLYLYEIECIQWQILFKKVYKFDRLRAKYLYYLSTAALIILLSWTNTRTLYYYIIIYGMVQTVSLLKLQT